MPRLCADCVTVSSELSSLDWSDASRRWQSQWYRYGDGWHDDQGW